VTLVLIVSGCTNITPQDVETAKVAFLSNDSSKCGKISDNQTRDICVMTVAQKTKNPDLCDKIKTNQTRDGCISGIALSTQNPAICERLSKPADREECKKTTAEIKTEALKAVIGVESSPQRYPQDENEGEQ
jgi:hypothetical protein